MEKQRPKSWEVIDVELAHVFYCDTESGRDAYKQGIELLGHRVIVREIKEPQPNYL